MFESRDYLLSLIFSQQAVVYENTFELLSYGLVHQHGTDRRIYAAGESQDHLAAFDFVSYPGHRRFDEGFGSPGSLTPADVEKKIVQNLLSVVGMYHFGMELEPKDLPLLISHRSKRDAFSMRQNLKTVR